MTISATTVRFDDATMWVELADGRTLGVPLAWFPRLLDASPTDREKVEIGHFGLYWGTPRRGHLHRRPPRRTRGHDEAGGSVRVILRPYRSTAVTAAVSY